MTRTAGRNEGRADRPLLVTLGLGVFAGALDLGVLAPALPALARGFNVSARDAAWVFTLYLFANVVAIPLTAKLADTLGRRPVYIACVATFGVGSVLAIVAPSFGMFLAARAIAAAGAGGIFPVATAAVADRIPVERRGAALGLLGALWGLAAVIGPSIGGLVTHFLGWRLVFAANVLLALIVIARARTQVSAAPTRARGPLDLGGMTLLSAALFALMVGLTRLDPAAPMVGGPLLFSGAVGFALLALAAMVPIERRAREPVIPPALFATRQLVVTYGLEVAIGALEGALFFVPAALVAAERLSYSAAGFVAAAAAVVFVAVIPLAGRALDRFGSRAVLAAGAALTAVGLGLFAATLQRLALALPSLVVAGIGFGALLGAPTRYIITNGAPATMRATAVGLLSVFLIIGQIVGGSLAGGLVGANIADVHGYRVAYFLFAAIAAFATLSTALLLPRRLERT